MCQATSTQPFQRLELEFIYSLVKAEIQSSLGRQLLRFGDLQLMGEAIEQDCEQQFDR